MPQYIRYRIKGGCYFFTVVISDRTSTLLTDKIAFLRTAFRKVRQAHPFEIEAIVILPDHLHCIWSLPIGDDDFSLRWRQIKSTFSRQLTDSESRSKSRIKHRERGIWQRRFWEHAIRDEQDFQRHVDYIHYNPVKHGYVKRVVDWKYSSFHRFVEQGIYSVNWGGEGLDMGLNFE